MKTTITMDGAIAYIEHCLQELCLHIGERPVGSANNQRAEQFISRMFRANGFDVEHQQFACLDWQGGAVVLQLDGAFIPSAVSPYSLPSDVQAPFQVIETLEALRTSDLSRQVAVLGGELTKEPIMPKNFTFWNPEHHQEIVRLLEERAPEAIVTASFSEQLPIPVFEDGDFNIPSAVVAGKYFGRFKAASGQTLRLQMKAQRKPSRGANVIARKGNPDEPRVVVMAHFDTKPGTPGALDNASGVAVLLQLSRLLQEAPVPKSIELIAMNGEDYYSTPGQIAYVRAFEKNFGKISLVVNCDGAGYKNGKTGVSTLHASERLLYNLSQKLQAFPALKTAPIWYQGDHMIFAPYQLPIIAITSEEIFPLIDTVIHTDKDREELVNAEFLRQTAAFIYEVIGER